MSKARVASALKHILRVEFLIAIGFFAGCFFTGLGVGLGMIK